MLQKVLGILKGSAPALGTWFVALRGVRPQIALSKSITALRSFRPQDLTALAAAKVVGTVVAVTGFVALGGPGLVLDGVLSIAPREVRELPGVRQIVGIEPPVYQSSVFGISAPLSVAVTPDAEFVYVAEGTGQRLVRKINLRDGERVAGLTPPGLNIAQRSPVSVTVVPGGLVYVVDRLRLQVDIYDADDRWIGMLPHPPGAGWEPLSVDSDEAGNLYVTSTADGGPVLLVYSPDESIVEWYPRIVADGIEVSFPSGVAAAPTGQIWVSDSNNGRLIVLQRGETEGRAFGTIGRDSLAMPRGIVIDDNGNAVVADTNEHLLATWELQEPSGRAKLLFRFGEQGIADGSFLFPNDVAVDGRGWLYVADRDNDRVQIWHD